VPDGVRSAVISVWVSPEGKYAFVEVRQRHHHTTTLRAPVGTTSSDVQCCFLDIDPIQHSRRGTSERPTPVQLVGVSMTCFVA
jgi:hypothetical protein